MENFKNKKLQQLFDGIQVSDEVAEMAESMREEIRIDVNRRIAHSGKVVKWRKITTIAASVIVLIGLSGYFFFQAGYNQINSAPIALKNLPGMKSGITLNDGTSISLNAASTLLYPSAFTDKNRVVELDGEAFFNVTPDASHPFIVKIGEINVRVLGTSFNVKAYADDPLMEVTLTEGHVEVGIDGQPAAIDLSPGQQAIFDKTNKTFHKKNVNADSYSSWKDNKYYFKNVALKNIAKQLERNYNISVSIPSDRLGETLLTGDFTKGENLEQMLNVLTMDKRIGYEIRKDSIILYEKLKK